MTTPTTLTITVTSAVTIIDADTSYFRYDNPDPSELVGYCLTLVDDEPAGYTIAIDAEENFVAELISAGEMAGFSVYAIAPTDDKFDEQHSDPEPDPEPAQPLQSAHYAAQYFYDDAPGEVTGLMRPVEEQGASSRSRLPVIVLSATVAVVLGAGIWAVGMSTTSPPQATNTKVPAVVESVAPAPGPVPEPAPNVPEDSAEAETVVISQDGLEVTLPAGFHLEADDDMWKAEGDDPDFRLQLAVDELYGLPGEELLKQVEREISDDPQLELVAVDDRHIEYQQYAVDGSEATWLTWVEAGVQLSVGCHSRQSPTTVQRATCQMAYESARYTAPAESL